jgi:RNA polymerase primary sigma factor
MKPRTTDPLENYLKEVASVQPLSKDEENVLFKQASVGNAESATRKLIESKLALVVAIAERYSSSGVPMLHFSGRQLRFDEGC